MHLLLYISRFRAGVCPRPPRPTAPCIHVAFAKRWVLLPTTKFEYSTLAICSTVHFCLDHCGTEI